MSELISVQYYVRMIVKEKKIKQNHYFPPKKYAEVHYVKHESRGEKLANGYLKEVFEP